MRKNIIVSTMIMMLIISMFPTVVSNNNNIKNINSDRDVYNNCYIEIEGDIYNQWKICFLKPFGDYRSTVVYWHLEFKPDSQIKIYDKLNGELLSEYSGERQINILAFGGIYIPAKSNVSNSLHVSINGNVLKIILKKLLDSPVSTIKPDTDSKILDDKKYFNNCYIELSGEIHNDWPALIKLPNLFRLFWIGSDINNILFGTYCYILYENDALITIYDEKDGNLIWEHDGIYDPLVTIIGFRGDYEYIDEPYSLDRIVFSGNTLFTSIKLGEWGH